MSEFISHNEGSPERKIYSTECLHKNKTPKNTGVISYEYLDVGPDVIGKTRNKKTRWEEIMKIKAEHSEIETKQSRQQKQHKESMNPKVGSLKRLRLMNHKPN